ncbi:phBC6A51 family helix-turn-helix protein [Clostridium butyricum]|uniref:phBC6A51 family helix-turn-helix protein n=1 Tax=Clostridium butyricum TaxID=1492 RepID=UPI0013D3E065|nr:phBC6A51 family helix-turn-helix protein [Clostridium butyricum]MCQ2016790.1 helix-turn-helix domain-containing protein [Clostridium butyricum]MCQ2022603.1 helix-turn-helix domain-containing protein [Clostridium butyricum]UTY54144.1 helix-turn-helix domain-containing protein [Clostridium butyricum]
MIDKQKSEAINYLVEGLKTREEIAKIIGVGERTLYRWLKDTEFKAECQKRAELFENDLLRESQSILKHKLGSAIDNIVEIANNPKIKEETRLKANQYLVDRVLGNTTTKIEQSNEGDNKDKQPVDIDKVLENIKEQTKDN